MIISLLLAFSIHTTDNSEFFSYTNWMPTSVSSVDTPGSSDYSTNSLALTVTNAAALYACFNGWCERAYWFSKGAVDEWDESTYGPYDTTNFWFGSADSAINQRTNITRAIVGIDKMRDVGVRMSSPNNFIQGRPSWTNSTHSVGSSTLKLNDGTLLDDGTLPSWGWKTSIAPSDYQNVMRTTDNLVGTNSLSYFGNVVSNTITPVGAAAGDGTDLAGAISNAHGLASFNLATLANPTNRLLAIQPWMSGAAQYLSTMDRLYSTHTPDIVMTNEVAHDCSVVVTGQTTVAVKYSFDLGEVVIDESETCTIPSSPATVRDISSVSEISNGTIRVAVNEMISTRACYVSPTYGIEMSVSFYDLNVPMHGWDSGTNSFRFYVDGQTLFCRCARDATLTVGIIYPIGGEAELTAGKEINSSYTYTENTNPETRTPIDFRTGNLSASKYVAIGTFGVSTKYNGESYTYDKYSGVRSGAVDSDIDTILLNYYDSMDSAVKSYAKAEWGDYTSPGEYATLDSGSTKLTVTGGSISYYGMTDDNVYYSIVSLDELDEFNYMTDWWYESGTNKVYLHRGRIASDDVLYYLFSRLSWDFETTWEGSDPTNKPPHSAYGNIPAVIQRQDYTFKSVTH